MEIAHTDDSATADFKSNLLQHMNILNTLVKGVGGADMAVIQIYIHPHWNTATLQ